MCEDKASLYSHTEMPSTGHQRLDDLLANRQRAGSTKRFMFLYHGGLLWRKGIDRLIQAYNCHFSSSDNVVLLVHAAYGQANIKVCEDYTNLKYFRNNGGCPGSFLLILVEE